MVGDRVVVDLRTNWIPPYGSMAIPMSKADAQGAAFATALGCTDAPTELACLRSKSPSELLHAVPWNFGGMSGTQGADWLPVVDGFVLPDDPMKLFAAGSFAKVPTLLGDNANEGSIFFAVSPTPPTDDTSYVALEEAQNPGHGAAVAAQYPAAAFNGSYTAAAAEAFGDGALVCPARRIARALAASGTPTYRYDFTHAVAFVVTGIGAFHSSELMFVFGNALGGVSLRDDELPLSKTIMDYWGAMAASADPNGSGRLAWPKYDTANETQLVLDLTQSTESAYKKAQCDFWDGLQ